MPTLEQRIIGTIRLKHYSRKTEMSYVQWYKRYVHFQKEVCGKIRHPAEMGAPEVEAFLTHLAANRDLASASQNQALNKERRGQSVHIAQYKNDPFMVGSTSGPVPHIVAFSKSGPRM